MNEIDLSITSYGKVKDKKYDLAILPWGSTEPHNYHLPYLTDSIISRCISLDALTWAMQQSDFRGMVLPTVTLGSQNPGQRELPFCFHARYETQKAILTDIVASLHCQDVHKLVIVNGHGGNSFKNMIRDLAVDYPNVTIALVDWYTVVPQTGYFEEKDDHAGEMETSLMMHYHPEYVSLREAGDGVSKPFALASLRKKTAWIPRHWRTISSDTGVGNPKKASAEKGARYAHAIIEKIGLLFKEIATMELFYGDLLS
jgi:creatinine amidohydrolase